MPKAGDKCPDCGHRFKAKRYDDNGVLTTDAVRSMTRFSNAPDGNIKAWYCRGESKQHPHPPQVVIIQRTGDKTSTQIVAMHVITPDAKKLLDEFKNNGGSRTRSNIAQTWYSRALARPTQPRTTIPEKIVHAMRKQAGDSLDWIWTTEGFTSYCKILKVAK